MFDDKIKTPQLLNSLFHHRTILNQLLGKNKEYNEFLIGILEYREHLNDDRLVHVKEVALKFNLTPSNVRRYLELIHDDIINYLSVEDREVIKPGPPVCSIAVRDKYYRYFYITSIQLDTIPREGETMEISFLWPYYSYSYWEVHRIYHFINYDSHEIHLELRPKLNRFVRMKEDEEDYEDNKKYYDEEMDWFSQKKHYYFKRGGWKES